MLDKLKGYYKAIVDILFPIVCLFCEKDGRFVCEDCLNKIERLYFQSCPICKNLGTFFVCNKCRNEEFFIDGLISATKYRKKSAINYLIHNFKYNFIEGISIELSKIIVQEMKNNISISEKGNERMIITAVPLHKKREKWRGFNQSELLAIQVSKELNIPYQKILLRKKNTKPQMAQKRSERAENINDAFALNGNIDLTNKRVFLIDDVATTMNTLNQCAVVLKEANATEVIAVVLARAF